MADTQTGAAAMGAAPRSAASQAARDVQLAASDPATSAFVSANAGSGKTSLLIDRLLRLMLAGADPQRILCLTYTKAAAAEMSVRLQDRLAKWVRMTDAELDAALQELTLPPGAALRARARALFAHVLDLPGGMRIATIHAFCQSVLKKFPLEAGISPYFALIEDAEAAALQREAREAALPDLPQDLLHVLAARIDLDGFGELLRMLNARQAELAPLLAAPDAVRADLYAQALGLRHRSEAALIAQLAAPPEETQLSAAVATMLRHGGATVSTRGGDMQKWLALPADARAAQHGNWLNCFFNDNGKPTAASRLTDKATAAADPALQALMLREQARLAAWKEQRAALTCFDASLALLRTAAPILTRVSEAKSRAARLDYDDLIRRTEALLRTTSAAWVLYKLDAGLDHLLLDEVQDTAPAQWEIADRLTADFFAGDSAERPRALQRTLFAVGDHKQSIFSFQGARPAEFARWQGIFGTRARAGGYRFHDATLDVSFRSTAPVLRLVDHVFTDPRAAHGVAEGGRIAHVIDRIEDAGRVTLWPLAPVSAKEAQQPWVPPRRGEAPPTSCDMLVEQLADFLAVELAGGVMLEAGGRPLRPGDVLVLVRRRSAFDRALTQALKRRHVPVAGLDRMRLTDQLAVADLLSLCRSLLLPEDDLSLAEWLKSPLGGLDEAQLMRVAMDRPAMQGTLLPALRAHAAKDEVCAEAWAFYDRLRGLTDFLPPFELLSEALGPLGGRARLLGRLGADAADAIDELLTQAIGFAQTQTPSLQGFLHWLERGGTDIKREAEAAGNAVRIMTAHGAKGLEAPLVILPDTTALPPDNNALLWGSTRIDGVPVPLPLVTRSAADAATLQQLRQALREEAMAEHNRLLYVALTRARDRLLICGWQGKLANKVDDASWYRLIEQGMRRAGAAASSEAPQPVQGWGEVVSLSATQRRPAKPARPAETAPHRPAPLPDFAGHAPLWRAAPAPPDDAARRLTPSRPQNSEFGPLPAVRSPLAGGPGAQPFLRGQVIHALLQHLPALDPAARHSAGLAYARAALGEALAARAAEVVAEATAVLELPELAPLFGPTSRAEQPIQGVVGRHAIAGLIDRLAVLPDAVWLADYKTNRDPPASPAASPVAYLRQMAAYRVLLRELYPGREIIACLIWTHAPAVHRLPGALLDAHDPQHWAASPGG